MNIFVWRLITTILLLSIPLVTARWLYRRYGVPVALMSVGAITFVGAFIAQTILLTLLPAGLLSVPLVGGVAVGLIAGFTEIVTVSIGFQYLAKSTVTRPQGVMIGVGHALLPMLFVALTLTLTMLGQISEGSIGDSADAEIIAEPIVNLAPLAMHVSVSWLVLQTFLRNEAKWLFYGIVAVALTVGTEAFIREAAYEPELILVGWWIVAAVGFMFILSVVNDP
ncbi:MAG: hypothetical protein L0154_05720 [Chloroflexi bacterium]|nr:hypothetical protein [Chloroflexota bacterium]